MRRTLHHHDRPAPRTARRGPSSMRAGFTLVELIAVLVLVSILGATAAPMIANVERARAIGAARELRADLSFARQHAVSTGLRTWVEIDTANQMWTVRAESFATPGRTNATPIFTAARAGSLERRLDAGTFIGVTFGTVAFDGGTWVGFDWVGEPLNEAEAAMSADGSAGVSGGGTVVVSAGSGLVRHVLP